MLIRVVRKGLGFREPEGKPGTWVRATGVGSSEQDWVELQALSACARVLRVMFGRVLPLQRVISEGE